MPMLCAATDKPDTVNDMTVVDDNYTGHVDPQTAARRTLPGASIVKVSVGKMDNNAYLVSCSQTGETLLIDAANDPEILLELIERFAPKLSLIVTSHQHFDHWQALEKVAKATTRLWAPSAPIWASGKNAVGDRRRQTGRRRHGRQPRCRTRDRARTRQSRMHGVCHGAHRELRAIVAWRHHRRNRRPGDGS